MEIREAIPEDKKGIAKVLCNCYNINSFEEGTETFEDEVKRGYHYIVADEMTGVVGLTTWTIHGRPKHGLAELDRIGVISSRRGNGIAFNLINGLIERAQDYYRENGYCLRKLFLWSHENNTYAHRFYERAGFTYETSARSHYYRDLDEFMFSMFFDENGNKSDNI